MALPEKALAEKLRAERGTGITTQREIETFLLDNLRADPTALRALQIDRLRDMAEQYRSRRIRLLHQWLQRFQKQQGGSHA